MATNHGICEALADFLEDESRWRETVADRCPDDARNQSSADRLDQLAQWVERLPEDDARLARLADLLPEWDTIDVLMLGDEAQRYVSRIGFDERPIIDLDIYVDGIIAAVERDVEEEARQASLPDEETQYEVPQP